MKSKKTKIIAIVGSVLFLFGSILSHLIDTNFGKTEVTELNITNAAGEQLAFTLYKPDSATAENQAPAIVLCHGGNGNREAMSPFAVELSRRGYVVLNLDQYKNGDSSNSTDPNKGIDRLFEYLYTLDFVDVENLGGAGHSAGGAVLTVAAANDNPYNLKSIVCNGVAVGGDAVTDSNINILYILGRWDENAGPSNWGVPGPKYATTVPKVLQAFGLPEDEEVVPGQLYGSIEDRSGRMLLTPNCFHAFMRYSPTAIGMDIDWFADTLQGGDTSIPSSSQIWQFKEFGYWLIMAGIICLMFVMVQMVLSLDFFKEAIVPENDMQIAKNKKFWIITIATCLVSMVSVQALYAAGKKVMSQIPGFQLEHTNGTIFWQLVIIFAVIALNFLLKKLQTQYAWEEDLKIIKVGWKRVLKLFLAGCIVMVSAVVLCYATRFFVGGHVKFVQCEITALSPLRWGQFARYFPLFLILQLIGTYVHVNGLRFIGCDTKHFLILTMLVNALSMTLLCIAFYGSTIFMDVSILHTSRFVIGSCLINMLPFTFVQSGIEVFCFKKTGSIYLAAFINAVLFTWMAAGSVMLAA